MSKYQSQKDYFSQAYRTGTDIWTHGPKEHSGANFTGRLPQNALILDLGTGRGLWAAALAKLGFRVVGIDYVGSVLELARQYAADEGISDRVRFVEADALALTIQDATFDAVSDYGLFHNLHSEDWGAYTETIARVLKPGGLFLIEVLSKETTQFFDLNPKASEQNRFEKYGVSYYFFTQQELVDQFSKYFNLVEIKQENQQVSGQKRLAVLSCLFQKK